MLVSPKSGLSALSRCVSAADWTAPFSFRRIGAYGAARSVVGITISYELNNRANFTVRLNVAGRITGWVLQTTRADP